MSHDQRTPNGGSTSGTPQGDGDNRSVKDGSSDTQKALDAAAGEPRDLPANGHGRTENPERNRRT